MPQITLTKAAGLYLQPNSLSVPEGSFEQLDNVVISQDNIIKKRRGFGAWHDPTISTLAGIADYLGYLFAFNTNSVKRLTSAGAVDATYTGQTVTLSASDTLKSSQANGNLYYLTSGGLQKIESVTDTTIYKAGIPGGLDTLVTLSGQTGIIQPDAVYGYRIVFGRRDNNNNLILGAPSELYDIVNSMNRGITASKFSSTVVNVNHVAHGLTTGAEIKVTNSVGNVAGDVTDVTITKIDNDNFRYSVTVDPVGITAVDYGVYKTATVEASIPSDIYNLSTSIGTKYFYQIYRTVYGKSIQDPSNLDDYVLIEDLQLVQEVPLTTTDLSNKYISYVDSIDDLFLGSFLYTNPNSGEGILQSNNRPPACQDLAFFKNHMFYANAQTDYTLLLDMITTLVSVIAVNDTISFTQGATTRTYTAKSSENTGSQQFKLTAPGGVITVSEAVDATARSLVRVINRDTSGLVYAYYVSSFTDAPGKMVFVSKAGATNFSVTASNTSGTAFSPNLPVSGTTVGGTNNMYTNAVYISKIDEPEAVPSVNFLFVGSRSLNILRLAVLRDSLIVITDQGVYRINGDSVSNFQSTLIDNTVPCVAKNSVAVLNNQVYYVSTQGVVAISDTAAQIVSRAIEPVLTAVLGKSYFSAQTRGVSYESERLYILSTVSPQATTADTVYCYNNINQTWFKWDTTFEQAIIKASDDKLYYITQANKINQERKNQNKLDFTDSSFSVTINTVDSSLLFATMTIVGSTATIGDVVVVNSVINRIVGIATNGVTITYTFAQPVNFVVSDTGLLYKGYTSTVKSSPLTGGDISTFKEFSEFQMSMRNQALTEVNIKFANDSVAESLDVTWVNALTVSGWGLFPWGSEAWGQSEGIDQVFDTRPAPIVRTYVPLNTSRGTYIQAIINHSQAAEDMSIQSMSYTARAYGHRTSK